jgi:lipoyl(octanoyl) transferase
MSDAPKIEPGATTAATTASATQATPERRRLLRVHRLGQVEYGDGIRLMEAFARARRNNQLREDVLLLLEHPPVLTLGRATKPEHILATPEELSQKGVERFETNRGGDVTYHGPGQLVGYPIFDLKPDRCDVHRYVRDLEEVLLRTLADQGLPAKRVPGWTGVWLGEKGKDARKVGAIGVHISRWITTHGFALNVSPQLDHFKLIVPCGINTGEASVTSIEHELGRKPEMASVEQQAARHMGEVFGADLRERRPDRFTVSVSLLRRGKSGVEALLLYRHPHRGGFWQPVTGTQERGETPIQTARREILEESGISGLEPVELGYRHAFAFESRSGRGIPRVFEETGFAARVEGDPPITLDRREHSDYRWAPLDEAVRSVPYLGLRKGMVLAKAKLFPEEKSPTG